MFPPLVWSVDRESTSDDVFKILLSAELSTADLQTKQKAVTATLRNICDPVYAFYSSSTDQSPIPAAFKTEFKSELERKENSDDTWVFRFLYNFAIRVSSRRTYPTRFRGFLGLRSPTFGEWEPYSFTKFWECSVDKTEYSENHTSYSVFEVNHVIEISGQSLSTKFTPTEPNFNASSSRNLEILLLLHFYTPDFSPGSKSSRVIDLEIESAISSSNFFHANFKTDFTTQITENKKFFCHSQKIRSVSTALCRLFDENNEPGTSSRIIKDWSSYFSSTDALQSFLKFVYFHEIPYSNSLTKGNSVETLFELLQFANKFDIKTLLEGVELSLVDHPSLIAATVDIDFTLGFKIYSFARKTKSLKFLQRCMRLALQNLSSRDPENKNRLVQLAKTDPELIVEILLEEKEEAEPKVRRTDAQHFKV